MQLMKNLDYGSMICKVKRSMTYRLWRKTLSIRSIIKQLI